MSRHYLDHNATAPLRPEVIDAVTTAMAQDGNSLSVHEEGRQARKALEEARNQLRKLVNAPVNGIIFTSGGTEAIHLGLHGLVKAHGISKIFVSAIEHSAVLMNAETTGASVEIIPVTQDGVVDLNWFAQRLREGDVEDSPFLVCLMAANNETGVIQPIREAADITHAAGGLLFCDGAQAVGKIPVNFLMLGADAMSLTGHKFGGPVGAGALVVGPNLPLSPVMRGGGHEENRRAGTHNVPAIVGLGVAAQLAHKTLQRSDEIRTLRDNIEVCVKQAGANVWGGDAERLPGTLCLSADGFSSATQVMAMDLAGISISAGSACSSGKTKASHVLVAMGASEETANNAVRVSLGWNSTQSDAQAFIHAWPLAYERVQEKSLRRGAA